MKRNLELEYDRLSKFYINYYNQYSSKKIFIRKPLESKWGTYFIKIVNTFGYRDEWNAKLFLKANFEENGLVYPQQLNTEKAWKIYLDYKPRFEANDKFFEEGIKATCLKINCYDNMKEFIELNKIFLKNGNFSNYVLFFSKTYLKWAKENNILKDYNIEKIKIKRALVSQNDKVLYLIKQALKEDFI